MFVFIHQNGPGGQPIVRLLAESGPLQGKVFRLKPPRVRLGKAADNEIVLPLPELEDYQLEIDLSGPTPSLRDQGSAGGTFVNDKRVEQATLKHGDRIRFGAGQKTKEKGGEIFLAKQPVVPLTDDVRTVLGNHGNRWSSAQPRSRLNAPPAAGQTPAPESASVSFEQRKFEVLLAVSKALSRPEDIEQKVHRVLDLLFDTMEIDRAALLVLAGDDGEGEEEEENAETFAWSAYRDRRGPTEEMPLSSTIINKVLQEGDAVLTQDAQSEDWLDGARSVLGQEIRTCVCTPLKTSSGILGVLYADSTRTATHPFSRQDMEFFTAFSNQAAIAVENSRLLRVALQKERMEQDLRVARNIQRMLFPGDLPALSGYQLAGDSQAMEQVGGDYFDYIQLDNDLLALVVGDVSGHGVSSALVMTMTRSVLRGSLMSNTSPSQLLQRVNQLVSEDMIQRMFVTMILCLIDLKTGRYIVSNAGHPPLLHFQANTGTVLEQKLKSPPLGMSRWARLKPRYKDLEGQMQPGDTIFLYTDGITEAAGEDGEQFEDHLESAFLNGSHLPPGELVEYIFNVARNFCGNQPIADDYTAIALKRTH